MAEGPRRRLVLLITLLIVGAAVVVIQLARVQIVSHGKWAGQRLYRQPETAKSPRGVIRDRDGYLLAGNAVMYSVAATPARVVDKEEAASELGAALHLPPPYIERQLETDEQWVSIARLVSKEVGEAVLKLKREGIVVSPVWVRQYPGGTLASHALGFCNAQGRGYYGVEGFYDVLLRPEPRRGDAVPLDAFGDPIPWSAVRVAPPQPGVELHLMLDRTVQALVEEELARSVKEYQAEGGTIIVMDPENFGILATASWPAYDPNRSAELADEEPPPFEDPAVSQQYEPGSVFKILTVAAALDSGMVTPDTTYHDQGSIEVGGQVLYNANRKAYGTQTVADVLIESLNVGAAWLSTQMGPDVFYRYLQDFGIGERTRVDLDNEVSGQLWLPDDYEHWRPSNLGTNAFGQGVAVTPIQMITAVAAVANDGTRLRPHIVDRAIDPDGAVSVYQPPVQAHVISPQTAYTLTEVLVRVVEEGVPSAKVEGYRVAGKTGTAQIPIPGGYHPTHTIATFLGFGPVPDPRIVILVKLDRPKTSPWASKTAAPAFQRLASRLFTVLGIPPHDSRALGEAER